MGILNKIRQVCLAISIIGFINWLYTIWISHFHPEWLSLPLTHLTLWLRTDTFGIISYLIFSIALILYFILKEEI